MKEAGFRDLIVERDEALAALSAVEADLRRKDKALVTLRGAWNAHMARCELDAEPQSEINRLVPTFEEIQSWANAPSNTASAAPVSPSEPGTQQAEEDQ